MGIIFGIGIAMLVMLLFGGCGIKNVIVAEGSSIVAQQDTIKTMVSIPCKESSYDDVYYYRALGTSRARDMRQVRTLAYRDAQQRLNTKISDGAETEFTFKANVICEEVIINESGEYEGYVVLEVAKDSIRYIQP